MKLTDKIYLSMRDDIFNAKYRPNELITERQIAEKYEISKLTAGEVLHRLCGEGHLTSYPRSGYMVTNLTRDEITQITKIRFALESLALEEICTGASDEEIKQLMCLAERRTEEDKTISFANRKFHLAMAALTKNRFLEKLIEDIYGTLSRVELVRDSAISSWQSEHVEIVKALSKRDLETAKEHLEKDLDKAI